MEPDMSNYKLPPNFHENTEEDLKEAAMFKERMKPAFDLIDKARNNTLSKPEYFSIVLKREIEWYNAGE